jgi:hypothetical protein
MKVSGQLHAPAASPPEKVFRYTLDRRLSVPQSRSGRGGEEALSWRESNPGRRARMLVALLTASEAVTSCYKHIESFFILACRSGRSNVTGDVVSDEVFNLKSLCFRSLEKTA